jgi:transposase
MDKKVQQSYTPEFRAEAVKLVIEQGMSPKEAAIRLNMNQGTLSFWVAEARKKLKSSHATSQTASSDDLSLEINRLKKELAEVKMERDILKNGLRARARPMCVETSIVYTSKAPGQRPLAYWRHSTPSKNLAQGKLRTQLWWHPSVTPFRKVI